jgi:signal transduction histidine kinase/CheY-like chemotaxis protein
MPKAVLANLSIRTKFLLLPAIAVLLTLVLGTIYVVGERRQLALQEQINSRDVPAMRELSRLFSELSTNHVQFVSLLASSFRGETSEGAFYAAGRKHIVAVNRTIEELRSLNGRLPGEASDGEVSRQLLRGLVDYRNQMGETVLQSSVDLERIAAFTLQANQAFDAANSRFLALIDVVQAHIGEDSRALQASLRQAQLRFFAALGVTLVIIVVGSLWLSRAFSDDLTALMTTLQRLSVGDSTVADAGQERRDEFGAVLRVVQAFRQALLRRDQAEQQLTHLNEELEARVGQRTEQLIASKEEAERANQAKSEFLSRMSHELRTPLNAILGFGQLIQLQTTDARQAGHVREILNAGRHLLELIDEILDLARVESGHLSVSPEPVALLPLLDDCLALLRPQAAERGVRLLDASRHCNVHVRADRTRLRQVLLNLLSNAVKYNRAQGTVSIVCVGEPAAVRIRVCDTGAGLTPDQQARLFVPFERLDAEERNIQGTGIGLALSRRLVELMGGTIGVESVPGEGSAFWVRLPTAEARPSEAAVLPSGETPAGALAGRIRHDVLCIEDNPANLRLIESIFERRDDIRLLGAIAPGLGLELARTHRPALILLDINLPDMDGYAVMQCLRESEATRHIPVVAISANAMPKDIERGKAAGFRDYLTKPLNVVRLMQVVDAAIAPARAFP